MLSIFRHLFRRKQPFLGQLPTAAQSRSLPHLNTAWVCCDDFRSSAKNHCHAVCICNLLRYCFPEQGFSFSEIHKRVGNGPVFSLQKMRKFCEEKQLPLTAEKLRSSKDLNAALADGHPCVVLMANRLWEWHWILVVGIAESADGQQFLRIVDGWHSDCDHWYKIETAAPWLSAYQFIRT